MAESQVDTLVEPVADREKSKHSSPTVNWLFRALRETAETVVPAIVIALFINLFLAQATQVLGQSMEPTLHSTQRVVVEKVTYRFLHGPRRGDVVIINVKDQSEMLIKRVVGLAGETLMVRAGQVYVDGQRLNESYIVTQGGGDYGPAVIPPLHVFVLGDNRGASNDSRRFGPVALSQVVGHAWFSYWPPDYIGLVQ